MTSNVYEQVLLTGAMETTFRTAGVPDLLTDSFDVGDLQPTPNIQRLQRNVQRGNFSPVAGRAGRKQQQLSFNHELQGSGVTDGSVPPPVGRLLRMCGMAQTQVASPGILHSREDPNNTTKGVVTAQHGTSAFTGSMSRLITVTMTTASAATVVAHETPNEAAAYSQTGVTVDSEGAIDGPEGSKLMLTYTGSLTAGDKYYFWFGPRGYLYTPVSDPESQESMYFYAYFGNKRHLLTGGRGSFSLSATAGEFGRLNFTVTGDYAAPVDIAFPTNYSYGSYPSPPVVELADVSIGDKIMACPTTFGFDLSNTVNARLCANAKGANDGAIITDRAPTATFNMDAVPAANFDIWSYIDSDAEMAMSGYVGSKPGNAMQFLLNGQLTNTQYANMENLRKNDNTLGLVGVDGNDELLMFFG